MPNNNMKKTALVIGAGPAGLMAAEVLLQAGWGVDVYDAMPSVGRKFLLAGKGGMNLTHSEPLKVFETRYGERQPQLARILQHFGPAQLRDWVQALGFDTFVGSSGRVFPTDMKAAPLLRAWLHRLREAGLRLHMRHRWTGWAGWSDGAEAPTPTPTQGLSFDAPQGPVTRSADAVVLALGGASWARLGSDGAWVPWLVGQGVGVAALRPSNCGFELQGGWSEHFASRFAGMPFKSVALRAVDAQGNAFQRKGEFVATATGVEGSLVYAASALLRDEITAHGQATFHLDLLPDKTPEHVLAEVRHPRGARSLSSHLKSRLHLDGIKMALLYEKLGKAAMADPEQLAAAIKGVPLTLNATRPIDEAISTAGGVRFDALTDGLMFKNMPGVFCAGEMLDWEAPTGGYLLTACFATGVMAGQGVAEWVKG